MTLLPSRLFGASAGLVAAAAAAVLAWPLIGADDEGPLGRADRPVATGAGPERSVSPPAGAFSVAAQPAVPAASQLDDARPRLVRLPSGVEVGLRPAATSGRGLLQVPAGIETAGWWDGGSRLGERYGAMLLAGHVDSASKGLGPFAELLDARRGQHVDVSADGSRQRFSIVSVEVVAAGALDDRPDLFSQRGPLRLVLITCAGPFIESQGGYQNRVVVTAEPVGSFASPR